MEKKSIITKEVLNLEFANLDYGTDIVTVQSLSDATKTAHDLLSSSYAPGKEIGEILVGSDINNSLEEGDKVAGISSSSARVKSLGSKIRNYFSVFAGLFFLLFAEYSLAADAKSQTKSQPEKKFSSQKTRSFYVSKREPYLTDDQKELCRQVARILDEPENKKFVELGFYRQTDFEISKKYTNFSLPDWEDVKRDDLDKYVKSESWLAAIKKYEDTHSDPKEKLIIQKANLDIDDDGIDEVVLRFGNYQHSILYWSAFVSDVNPSVVTKGYNEGLSGFGAYARPFKYKNKVYQIGSSGFDSVVVEDPVHAAGNFVTYPMCFISLTPLAQKSASKEWKKFEEQILEFKKLNQVNSPTSNNN